MQTRPSDLTRTLMARARQARAVHHERRDRSRRAVELALLELRAAGELRRAWLIGSVLDDAFGERSDVDVVIEGVPLERLADVREAIGEHCPVAVDVLRFEDLPPSFRARVDVEGAAVDGA
jgi:predicted nucleotidyltransferase